MCRDCGAVIRGEVCFVRDEGEEGAQRARPRHLMCAAQSWPAQLLRALELAGWDQVPEEDHDELRARIDDSLHARGEAGQGAQDGAARSSSAMIAAAVLEPARAARRLRPEVAQAWVFADRLQAQGDERGELLAVELAAEHTEDPSQARMLQRERARLWAPRRARIEERLAGVRLRFVGGFLIGAHPEGASQIGRLLAAEAAETLARVRLDFCTQEELARLVDGATVHGRAVAVLDLPNSRTSDLGVLGRLPRLRRLRVGERLSPGVLAELPSLRALSLVGRGQLGGEQLGLRPELERLECSPRDASALAGIGARLPALEWLSLGRAKLEGLAQLGSVPKLEVLRLPGEALRELDGLEALPSLRELQCRPGTLRLVRELPEALAAPQTLERLALLGSKVGELDALAGLPQLRHLALVSTRVGELEPLRRLTQLRSVQLEGGDMRRMSGLARLEQLEQLGLGKLANVELAALRELPRLHTLTLRPGGRRPGGLEALASLSALRRLSMPMEVFAALDDPASALAGVEVLELVGEGWPPLDFVAASPRLRRLLLPGRSERDPWIDAVRERTPEVVVHVHLPPRDLLDHRDLYDWRAGPWPSELPRLGAL